MPRYSYHALDNGQRPAAGEVDAETVSAAIAELESRGLIVQSITRTADFSLDRNSVSLVKPAASSSKPSSATAIEAGRKALRPLLTKAFEQAPTVAPLLRAYSAELPLGSQRQELQEVIGALEAANIDQALAGFRDQAQWWLPLLGALNGVATPGAILQRFVSRIGPPRERRRSWWVALPYPLTLIAVISAILVMIGLLIVPMFGTVFDSFDMALPASTSALLEFSAWLRTGWALLAFMLSILLAAFLLIGSARSLTAQRMASRVLAQLPRRLTPRRLRSLWLGRFAASVADALDAGTTLPGALRVAALAAERPTICTAASDLADEIELDAPCGESRFGHALSSSVAHAVRSNLPLPTQIQLLREISRCQLEQTIRRGGFSAAVGPISVVLAGILVTWIVLALFQPLVNLVGSLS